MQLKKEYGKKSPKNESNKMINYYMAIELKIITNKCVRST